MKTIIVTASAIALLGAVGTAQAAGDAAAGKQKATTVCVACHGADGNGVQTPPVPHVPKLAGQNELYLVKALKAYKSGERKESPPLMTPMAAPLSDADIENLAAYYASQTPK